MESVCKHCRQSILLVGYWWVHLKTDSRYCAEPLIAEPVERAYDHASADSPESFAYREGVRTGRESSKVQDRKTKQFYRGSISPVGKELLAQAFNERRDDVREVERVCESPAEELFALAMIVSSDLRYDFGRMAWINETITMAPQVPIGHYRVDFIFNDWLVVEIDGHDFHDRDQEQASADRRRDRDLMRLKVSVIRFTGSDVFNFALRCASEVDDLLRLKQ